VRDVSGRGVQTNLLKLMEDGDVPLVSPNDVTGQLQAAMSAMRGGGAAQPETINTRHILFIVSGAFSGLERLVRARLLAAGGPDAGGVARLTVDQLLARATTPDLVGYGLEPEFIGRLPVRVACHGLDTDDLFDVLRKSESSLIHQYERAFAAYGIACEFRDDGLRRLAERAAGENTGARGLMTVCERVFRDLKFRLPNSRVRGFAVTARLVDDPAAELRRLLRARG
jgi:ATP-dependent protease Clp ATPase subunit